MIGVKFLFGAVGVTIACWLGFVLVRFNLKRLRIIRAAAAATSEQLKEIYRLIGASGSRGSQRANGFVLGRLNEAADDPSCTVAIPNEMEEFPWAGKSIAVEVDADVQFRVLDESYRTIQLQGQKYWPVSVPTVLLKSGKVRNQFSPSQYVKGNRRLQEQLASICPEYPTDLLSYLLCVGGSGFEFEPIDQVRIGTSAAWVQDPELQYCDHCKKRMALILQLPGALLHDKAFQEETFYLFGCKKHSDQTRTVSQLS